jgi:hypothetical protein
MDNGDTFDELDTIDDCGTDAAREAGALRQELAVRGPMGSEGSQVQGWAPSRSPRRGLKGAKATKLTKPVTPQSG